MVKFGIFLPNGSNGYIMSAGSPQYLPTYEHNKAIALAAEDSGFDMILSMMKYRGFGGSTGYWDQCLESFTLMAGLAAVTKRLELFPTVTIPVIHPALAARYVATIDDISGGRCGLNIVTGWNRDEYDQMGLWPGDDYYTERYDYAGEYVSVLREIWKHGRVTMKTEHFTLDDCTVLPQPRSEITVVSAGQSPAGARFVSKHADRNFVQAGPEKLAEIVSRVKGFGRDQGRDVGTYAVFHLIVDEDAGRARALEEEIVDRADEKAISNMIASALLDANPDGISQHQATGMSRPPKEGNSAFMTIPTVTGCYRAAARQLDEIIGDTGVDGVLFSFPDFVGGARAFGAQVRPLMKTA